MNGKALALVGLKKQLDHTNISMPRVVIDERIGKLGRLAVGCSASIFDPTGQKMLLSRRADDGHWCVPGGYMEAGESVSEACVREVLEETGLEVKVKRLIGIYTTPHRLLEYDDGNRWQLVVLHFEAETFGGTLGVSNEAIENQFFLHSEIDSLQMNDLDRRRALDGFKRQVETVICDDFAIGVIDHDS